MPSYVGMGRRRNDLGLMIDFHKHRAMLKAKTSFIEGIPLEEIPEGPYGFHEGIVLIHRDWENIYFVKQRSLWDEDTYFNYAVDIFKQKKMKP